ncbi:alpha,alpha-trehalase nth1, partial [Elasticomyces elasticus]
MNSLDRKATFTKQRCSSSAERQDPYAPIETYYDEAAIQKKLLGNSRRAVSSYNKPASTATFDIHNRDFYPRRRGSHDEYSQADQELLINVDKTIEDLLSQEDKDRNYQITIEDDGPKHIKIGTLASAGYRSTDLRGNYVISNLLQELTLAQDLNKKIVKIHRSRLNENPVDRLSRRIRDEFWKNLKRCLDATSIEKAGKDPKDWTDDPRPRIYIPHGCPEQFEYYTQVAKDRPEIRLDVKWLPEGQITPEFVRDLNAAPGILALAMREETINGKPILKGEPFTVPGGRFNEFYGWDSYMESIGLIEQGQVSMAKSMAINFAFCIQHYGKILNANRSYYLYRSQPPFLTDMALK